MEEAQRANVPGLQASSPNAEIQQIISDNDLTPILEKEAAVKYITWDKNQWLVFPALNMSTSSANNHRVSSDDEETLEMKRTYASGKCLGGRMVWAAMVVAQAIIALFVSNLMSSSTIASGLALPKTANKHVPPG